MKKILPSVVLGMLALITSGCSSASASLSSQALAQTNPSSMSTSTSSLPRYHEIVKPSGFIHADPFKLEDIVGKKIVMISFMTYGCINCIHTMPYLNAWYEKYKDQGFEIVGIHTPEFAYEHKIENVRSALEKYGIKFPVVLDNDYATWNAYGNNYWPRKYIIDLDGHIVYDHIGEGDYDGAEKKIQELLQDRKNRGMMIP